MGLIKAFTGALGGTLADQWKEFFYCDSLSENVLVAKGQKRAAPPTPRERTTSSRTAPASPSTRDSA